MSEQNICGLCSSDTTPTDTNPDGKCCNVLCRGFWPPFPTHVPTLAQACTCEPNGAICGYCLAISQGVQA